MSDRVNYSNPREVCDEDQSYIFLFPVQLGMCLAYLLIFLVGVVGNMLVLVVVLTNPHMQTTTNMYLVNLSAADILMCLGKHRINLKVLASVDRKTSYLQMMPNQTRFCNIFLSLGRKQFTKFGFDHPPAHNPALPTQAFITLPR